MLEILKQIEEWEEDATWGVASVLLCEKCFEPIHSNAILSLRILALSKALRVAIGDLNSIKNLVQEENKLNNYVDGTLLHIEAIMKGEK